MHSEDLAVLENRTGYHFRDRNLLLLSLTHTSYANEHRKKAEGSNERLEFLGDSILDFVAAEYLYETYPDLSEGELSKIRASMVSEKPLAKSAEDIQLQTFIRLGKGEETTGGRNKSSIISDAMEALIGAIFLDGGFSAARTFVREAILSDLRSEDLFSDSKTPLQEILQDMKKKAEYRVIRESGPDHDKKFTVAAYVDGKKIGEGTGRTKKSAAQAAAEQAIENLRKTDA